MRPEHPNTRCSWGSTHPDDPHQRAMEIAGHADMACRFGWDSYDPNDWSRAFDLEREAAQQATTHWLGHAVLARSAAWLGLRAGRIEEALKVAQGALEASKGWERVELEEVIAACHERLGDTPRGHTPR